MRCQVVEAQGTMPGRPLQSPPHSRPPPGAHTQDTFLLIPTDARAAHLARQRMCRTRCFPANSDCLQHDCQKSGTNMASLSDILPY